jgi:hypothetical protein
MLLLGTTSSVAAASKRLLSRLTGGPGGVGIWWALIYLIAGVGGFFVEMRMTQGLAAPVVSWLPAAHAVLVSVQVALAGAAIPILLFVIGVAREDSALPMAVNELLVRDTQVLQILTFGLAGVVQVVLDGVLASDPILFLKDLVFVCLWSVLLVAVTYTRALRLLVQPAELARRSVAILTKKMEGSLRYSATLRVARGLAASHLRMEGIRAGIPREERGNYASLGPFSDGVLTDLNLVGLADLASAIRAASPLQEATDLRPESPRIPMDNTKVGVDICFAVSVGDQIDASQRALLYVPSRIMSEPRREEWERRLRAAVKVRRRDSGGQETEFSEALAMLLDTLVVDLRAGRLATVEKGLRVLTELALAFSLRRQELEERVRTAAPATFDSLFEPRSYQAPQWWDFLDVLFEESLVSDRAQFIRLIHGFPASIAWRALSLGLSDIFEEAIEWLPRLYVRCILRVPERLEGYFVDHTWRLLFETVRFQILPEMEYPTEGTRNAELRFCLLATAKAMAKLLKLSFDSRRPNDFAAFAKAVERTRKAMRTDSIAFQHGGDESESTLDLFTTHIAGPVDEGSRTKAVASTYLVLSVLAIDGWMAHKFGQGKLDRDEYMGFRSAVVLPQSVSVLWGLLIRAEELDADRVLGWDWWELEEHEEGEGYWGDFTSVLVKAVVLRSLTLLARAGGGESKDLTVPPHRNLRAWSQGGNSIVESWLKKLEQEPEIWTPVVGGDVLSLVPILRERIGRALVEQEDEELRRVVEARISRRRVASVQREIIKAWKEAARVRVVFEELGGAIRRQPEAPEGTAVLGYNVLDPREAYIESEGTSFPSWGEQFGQGLGVSENTIVMSALVSTGAGNVSEVGSQQELSVSLEACLADLAATGYSPAIMLVDPPWWVEPEFLARLKQGRRPGLDAAHWYCGEFEERPVARLHLGQTPMVVLVDFSRAALWQQYRPRRVKDEDEILDDDLLFRLTEIDEAGATDLLAKQPDLARQGEAAPQTILRLRAKVGVRVFETFEFQVVDKQGIRMLRFQWSDRDNMPGYRRG